LYDLLDEEELFSYDHEFLMSHLPLLSGQQIILPLKIRARVYSFGCDVAFNYGKRKRNKRNKRNKEKKEGKEIKGERAQKEEG
jgi:hypothetical protein